MHGPTVVALWIAAVALIVAGFIATILPGMPGVLIIYAGMWLAAWIDDFARIGWVTLTILGILTALALAADVVASALGAKRAGASRQALIGSVVGGIAGIFFGLIGLLLGPFIGAVVGELMARGSVAHATHVGVSTWIGLIVGTMAKIAAYS